jgi:leucyl/phenylalanyl-tRNA--protein transferase
MNIIEADLLLAAYASGYFPMADSRRGAIGWYSPDPRAIIPLEGFKISRSLKQTLRKQRFEIHLDTAFEEVIRNCGDRESTWISEEIIQSYLNLYRLGFAHSVESWQGQKLAGGLYGVALGSAFFGESMFSRVRDASKIALVYLVEHLKKNRFELLDTQFITPHLRTFGAIEIPREDYLVLLSQAVKKDANSIPTKRSKGKEK